MTTALSGDELEEVVKEKQIGEVTVSVGREASAEEGRGRMMT